MFGPEERLKTIQVQLAPDDVFPEGSKSFAIFLTAAPGVYLSPTTVVNVTILNDDPALPGKTGHFHACHETSLWKVAKSHYTVHPPPPPPPPHSLPPYSGQHQFCGDSAHSKGRSGYCPVPTTESRRYLTTGWQGSCPCHAYHRRWDCNWSFFW